METIESIQEKIVKFRDERDWKQFHNPKDLAISLSLEAAELLEVFQWSGADLDCSKKKDKIAEELADVMLYGLLLAAATGLDVKEIMLQKIKKNCEKYPVEKAFGSSKKYTEF